VNTTGFKKARAEFQDLLYQEVRAASAQRQRGNMGRPVGVEIGLGTRLVATQKMFETGDMKQTQNQLDLAIQGEGFFRVRLNDNDFGYSRAGELKITAQGQIVTTQGHPLEPPLFVEPETTTVIIDSNGLVKTLEPGQTQPTEVGNIELVRFPNPAGLKALGDGIYLETETSGRPVIGTPGEDGVGSVEQGMLESSNVEVVEEMIDLIAAQRAYEINSRVIRAADEMLADAAQLR